MNRWLRMTLLLLCITALTVGAWSGQRLSLIFLAVVATTWVLLYTLSDWSLDDANKELKALYAERLRDEQARRRWWAGGLGD